MTTHTLHIYAIQKTNNSQQSVYLHVPVNILDSAFPLSLNEMVLALGCSVYDTVQNYDNMKQITNKEYEAYQQYQSDRLHGRILTPDGLRVICAGLDNDPEKIGKHMLEMLAKFRSEGVLECSDW
jgi:hypothetical protein